MSDNSEDNDKDDLPDPRTLPRNALDKEGWKALALAWKRRADAIEQQADAKKRQADALEQKRDATEGKALEVWQRENKRRANLGIPPLPLMPILDGGDDSDNDSE